jgi:hypothetical protein
VRNSKRYPKFRSCRLGVIVVTGAMSLFASPAVADAPRSARILEGRSMAGVSLDRAVSLAATGDRVRSGVLAGWGVMRGGSCFEGTNCSWDATAGGSVEVILNARNSHVQRIATTAPGWRTAAGIRIGSTTSALRRAYGRRIARRTTCGLNGFGGQNRGFVLNGRHHGERRFTFFELSRSGRRVSRLWIARGRVAPATVC